jgi:predicted membrane metal-binding protein
MIRRTVTMYLALIAALLLAQSFGWLDGMSPPVEIARSL